MPLPERFSKRTRTSIASDAWSTLSVIFAVAAAFVINRTFDLGYASWVVGVGIFFALIYVRVRIEHNSRMRQLHEYLQSLPPGERLDALDKYYNGALSSVTQTPEYRDVERIVRGRMERSA